MPIKVEDIKSLRNAEQILMECRKTMLFLLFVPRFSECTELMNKISREIG